MRRTHPIAALLPACAGPLCVIGFLALVHTTALADAGVSKDNQPAATALPSPGPAATGTAQPSPIPAAGFKIIAAKWGIGTNFADVTKKVQEILGQPDTDFTASTEWLQSNPSSFPKMLVTTVEAGQQQFLLTIDEGDTISVGSIREFLRTKGSVGKFQNLLPPAPDAKGLTIISAKWGAANNTVDVTDRVKEVLDKPRNEFPVDPDWLQGDPFYGMRKTLTTTFQWNGTPYTLESDEGTSIGVRQLRQCVHDGSK